MKIWAFLAALFVGLAPADAADFGSAKDIDARDRGFIAASEAPFIGLGVGASLGGHFASIDIADEFDGISADGITYDAHAEWLFGYSSTSWRFGPYAEIGGSTVNTELSDRDVLALDHFYGVGAKFGLVFNQTLVSVHAGYEWQQWGSDLVDIDVDTGWWNVGAGIETLVAKNFSVGLKASYLILNDAEGDEVGDITDLIDESEALRIQLRATFRQ